MRKCNLFSKEMFGEFRYNANGFKEINFYPGLAAEVYLFKLRYEKEISEKIEDLKSEIDTVNNLPLEIDGLDDDIKNAVYRHFDICDFKRSIEFYISSRKGELKEEEYKLKDSNLKCWAYFINGLLNKMYYNTSSINTENDLERDELKGLLDIPFEYESIKNEKDNILFKIKKYYKTKALRDFAFDYKHLLKKDGKKIEPNKEYEFYSINPWYVDWDDKASFEYTRALYALSILDFMHTVNEPLDDNLEELIKVVEKLDNDFKEGKRLSCSYLGNEIKFFKTKATKIKFSEKIAENLNNC